MNWCIVLIILVVVDYDEVIVWYIGKFGFVLFEDIDQGYKCWVVVGLIDGSVVVLLLVCVSDEEQCSCIGNQIGGCVVFFFNIDDFYCDYVVMLVVGVEFLEVLCEEFYVMVVVFCDLYGNIWDLLEFC